MIQIAPHPPDTTDWDGVQERERWTEAIVRDELARPAEISEMFLKGWEQRAEEDRKRRLKV